MNREGTASRWVLDTRAPLECCRHPSLHRQLGVLASAPFHHHGLNAEYVDVSGETVTVNTVAFGTCYPSGEVDAKVREFTGQIVADLNKVITELTAHRDRLAATLAVSP
jgi:hypothetical protein